jgi:hypothetical protein
MDILMDTDDVYKPCTARQLLIDRGFPLSSARSWAERMPFDERLVDPWRSGVGQRM